MRFRTIWTIKSMSFIERLRRTRDWAALSFGAKLPLRVRYWVTMVELGKATSTSQNIPATSLDEILKNLDQPKSMS